MGTRQLHIGPLQLRWNWLIALAILLAVSGFVRLGLWQLDRAAEKLQQQAAHDAAATDSAVPLAQVPLAGLPRDLQQHQNRRVLLRGHYLADRHVFLVYQTWEEQLGHEVLSLFQLNDGRIALVSRGWSALTDPEQLAASLDVLQGTRDVEGQLHIPTPREAARVNPSRNQDWPLIRRYVNMDELEPLVEAPLFPYVVRLAPGEPGLLVRHWPEVVVVTDRHYSYALQWFAMALAVLLVSLLLASNLRTLWRNRSTQDQPRG